MNTFIVAWFLLKAVIAGARVNTLLFIPAIFGDVVITACICGTIVHVILIAINKKKQ